MNNEINEDIVGKLSHEANIPAGVLKEETRHELKQKLGLVFGQVPPKNKKEVLLVHLANAYSNYINAYSLDMSDDEISKARAFYEKKLSDLKRGRIKEGIRQAGKKI